ncbi:phage tail sheath subtilisin-like domain-containing protein [Spiribacter halobius]|uniref:Phage tail protein n=1 Tax=Sediminicurvatus halobius TaxID=2182432 RepID=A0A2U2N1J8_9GAMM|nr:phage tail sheath subtilisin-like domain-containing protein [Spiribacter halobius]PWG62859.1 phage tail protein [Spiribacter halobius]UEX76989.1 phage tail sheath subtilisin-like domain-containing protein [Spiribacter halobius]
MTISSGAFSSIPAALRIPGVYIEFDSRLAGSSAFQGKLLVFGQRLAAGERAALELDRVTSAEQAERLYGRGSMLAEMLRATLSAAPYLETWAIALDDDGTAVKAAGDITVAGTANTSGTLALYIAGYRVRVGVAAADTASTIAQAIVDEINADTRLPVTAAVNGTVPEQVDLTARWAGETGNDIDVRLSARGEDGVSGVTFTITDMAGGSANPDLGTAIPVMGDEWWNWIACPYTDSANLDALEAELDDRWGPMRQIGGRAFTAYRGTHSETGTFGSARNSPHVTCMGTGIAVSPTWLWAATNAAAGARALAIDPARPLQTLELPGLMGPAEADRFTDSERNLLLYDGISTYRVATDGTVRIERQITMYQENAAGIASDAYLDIQVPETLERIRFEQRSMILRKYPRHKLAGDADASLYGAGQPIATPKIIKAELLGLYRTMIGFGWVQDYEGYAESLTANIDPEDPNRLNVIDSPQLVSGYRVHAMQTQFRR